MKRQWSGTDTIELYLLPQTPYGKETQKIKTAQSKTAHAESQDGKLFPSRYPPGYPKQIQQIVKD